jgi:hypothetical protein
VGYAPLLPLHQAPKHATFLNIRNERGFSRLLLLSLIGANRNHVPWPRADEFFEPQDDRRADAEELLEGFSFKRATSTKN